MKRLSKTEQQAVELAILIAKSAVSDLLSDRRLLKLKSTPLKHTIERLGSIQNLLQSVLLQ